MSILLRELLFCRASFKVIVVIEVNGYCHAQRISNLRRGAKVRLIGTLIMLPTIPKMCLINLMLWMDLEPTLHAYQR
jgi:hypothetical protein